jgi:transposase
MELPKTNSTEENGVQLKTILNRVEKHPLFVYGQARFRERGKESIIEVPVRPRSNSRPVCSGCNQPGPGYDTLPERRIEFVPLWNILVFFLYAMRRVDCVSCGVHVEEVPWVEGKNHLTTSYRWFLASWAQRMSWKDVAKAFRTSWENVFRSVEMAVKWGREHRDLEGIESIGIDEIYWSRSKKFLTLVYQIDQGCKRLLWVGRKRKLKTLLGFFRWFGKKRSAKLRFICSDMWQPYLRVVAKKAGQAVHVLDRFHIMSHMSKAIDEVRAKEVRELKAKGLEPILTRTRWLFLKRVTNLTKKQGAKLADVVQYNLREVMRSRIDPMKRVARMLRHHRPLILNWFRAKGQVSSGTVEGFNGKARVITRRAFGFRTYNAIEVALYHTLGALPEPELSHRFC